MIDEALSLDYSTYPTELNSGLDFELLLFLLLLLSYFYYHYYLIDLELDIRV